ncbi:hypothetical protein [Neisseria chenwenguii]|uniref:hypothetical protein n=1 Tax=Neisseria chenwenguii TaxID=1853278 RepID=UPI0012FE71CC|nr:hypothetical protein [Neisseria chenwenguii]
MRRNWRNCSKGRLKKVDKAEVFIYFIFNQNFGYIMKKLILFLSMVLVLPSSFAVSNAEISNAVREATSLQYCGFEAEKVLRHQGKAYLFYFTAGTPYEDEGITKCSAGSGTGMVHLAQLDNYGRVIEADVLENLGINTRFIDVKSAVISSGILTFRNSEFGTDPVTGQEDGNCCANDMYINQIQLSNLRLLNRRFIGRGAR